MFSSKVRNCLYFLFFILLEQDVFLTKQDAPLPKLNTLICQGYLGYKCMTLKYYVLFDHPLRE